MNCCDDIIAINGVLTCLTCYKEFGLSEPPVCCMSCGEPIKDDWCSHCGTGEQEIK